MHPSEKGFNCETAIKANGGTPDDTPFKGSLSWQSSSPNTGLSEVGAGAPNGVAGTQIGSAWTKLSPEIQYTKLQHIVITCEKVEMDLCTI
jgi:hypothetical protein